MAYNRGVRVMKTYANKPGYHSAIYRYGFDKDLPGLELNKEYKADPNGEGFYIMYPNYRDMKNPAVDEYINDSDWLLRDAYSRIPAQEDAADILKGIDAGDGYAVLEAEGDDGSDITPEQLAAYYNENGEGDDDEVQLRTMKLLRPVHN